MEPFKKLEERFGKDGLNELSILDMRGADLIYRMYMFTSIAANLRSFDEALGLDFYNKFIPHINSLMEEMTGVMEDFQKRRGEL